MVDYFCVIREVRSLSVQLITAELSSLLDADGRISPYTQDVFSRLNAAGIRFLLCSTQPLPALGPYCEALQAYGSLSFNGGLGVSDSGIFYDQPLTPTNAGGIVRLARQNRAEGIVLLGKEHCWYSEGIDAPAGYAERIPCDFSQMPTESAYEIDIELANSTLAALIESANAKCKMYCFRSGNRRRYLHKLATKESALNALLQTEGLSWKQVLSFGMDHSDTELLARSFSSVAPEDAVTAARQAAEELCPAATADGVAHYIENNIL